MVKNLIITIASLITIVVAVLILPAACQQEKPSQALTMNKESLSSKGIADSSKESTNNESFKLAQNDTPKSVPLVTVADKFEVVERQVECDKPTVIEFFAYHCKHCYTMHPQVIEWREKNKDKVDFVMIPSHLGHQQLSVLLLIHHAAKAVGVLDKAQDALFDRFHKEKKLFGSEDEAVDFLVQQGADKDKARQALTDQKALTEAINADFELLKAYKITSVPKLLVNHRYITNAGMAGGHEQLFKVVDELLKKEHECHAK